MADSQLYDVVEALRAKLNTEMATEKSRLSLSVSLPASGDWKIIGAGYNRSRHTTFPFGFVIPFPDGQAAPATYETTKTRVEWRVPVIVEVIQRQTTGVELDHLKEVFEYAQLVDSVIVNNQTLGRSDTLCIATQDFTPTYFQDSSGALWGVDYRTTLEVQVDYA